MDSLNSDDFELKEDIDLDKFKHDKQEQEYAWGTQTTVKFYTTDAKVFTKSYMSYLTMEEIKTSLVDIFNIPYTCLLLLYKEEEVRDNDNLRKFKADKYGILEFKLKSKDKTYKIRVEDAYKDLTVPDILTVRVQKDQDQVEDVVVEVENQAIEKPFIGGYRDARTGAQYHHGFTQTGPPPPKVPPDMKNHRDTQTYDMRNRKTDKDYEQATQMHSLETYITSITDKILTARPYETAEEKEKRLDIEGKVRTIQRYFRAWKMRKALKELSAEYHKRMRLEQEREEREQRRDNQRRKKDMIGKVFPMNMSDFAMLYSMVERWKKSEIDRIRAEHCGAEKITEFYLLLDKEIEILQSIDRLRLKLNKDKETKQIVEFFKAIGQPLEWESNYKKITMDTLQTQKGREYFALYQRLCDRYLSKEEMIQVYMDVKDYLKSHDCSESTEINKLIDRACELLARGMEKKHMRDLQKRIEALVFHHFKSVECNEGVTYQINKNKMKTMVKDLMYCASCRRLKPVELFSIDARTEKIRMCTSCQWLDTAEEPRIDFSPYKYILKQIRNYERLHHAVSSMAFIVQAKGIYQICTQIWHGHSALSECNDIYELRLVRWDRNKEWAPWNCILLTVEEAKCHLRIEKLDEVYEAEFLSHVFNKHALTKKLFPRLLSYDKHYSKCRKGDLRLNDDSEYYNKPSKEKCLGDSYENIQNTKSEN